MRPKFINQHRNLKPGSVDKRRTSLTVAVPEGIADTDEGKWWPCFNRIAGRPAADAPDFGRLVEGGLVSGRPELIRLKYANSRNQHCTADYLSISPFVCSSVLYGQDTEQGLRITMLKRVRHPLKNQTHTANGSRDIELFPPDQATDLRSAEIELDASRIKYTEK
ncbi:hypothetical protein CBL_05909 [Carabus blaptoides fortunei]